MAGGWGDEVRWFWDREGDGPLPGMSRRRFVFLGVAAGVGALVAPQLLVSSEPVVATAYPSWVVPPINTHDEFVAVLREVWRPVIKAQLEHPPSAVRLLSLWNTAATRHDRATDGWLAARKEV